MKAWEARGCGVCWLRRRSRFPCCCWPAPGCSAGACCVPSLRIRGSKRGVCSWSKPTSVSAVRRRPSIVRGCLTECEVIGIVKDIRSDHPTRIDPTHIYLPTGPPGSGRISPSHGQGLLDLGVRVRGDRQRAVAAIEATVAAFDKDLVPGLRLINLEDGEVRPQKAFTQLFAVLAAILGGLAVTLAGGGIYGVVACLVSQRTRE